MMFDVLLQTSSWMTVSRRSFQREPSLVAKLLIFSGWQAPAREASGAPIADPTKFPSGVANLSAQIHSMGLKVC